MANLKPGDVGWKPGSPYGICPCCGSTLEWERDRTQLYLDNTVFTGFLEAVDIRFLHNAKDHLQEILPGLDGTVKALCQMVLYSIFNTFGRFESSKEEHALWRYARPSSDSPVDKTRKVKVTS